MKKANVIILAKSIDGGTGTFFNQLLTLKKYFLTTPVILEKPQFRTSSVSILQNCYISNSINSSQFLPILIYRFIKEYFLLFKFLCKNSPDIIVSIDSHSSLLACLLKIFYFKKVKVIITFHNCISKVANYKLSTFSTMLLKKSGHLMFGFADEIICVSKGVSKDVKDFFSLKCQVRTIYLGLNLKKTKELSKVNLSYKDKKLFAGTEKIILSIGRFETQKDFETLIKAFSIIKQSHNAKLFIIGDGKNKNILKELAIQLGISKHIFFLGWKKNVYPYLKNCDVFALSSHYEGFPYVLLEALAVEKPVVSTNCMYGPSEILGNGKYGILVPPNNPQKMAEAIIKVIGDNEKNNFLLRQLKKRDHFFSEKKMIKKYYDLIASYIDNS